MIAAALLACAVNVSPVTLEAVIRIESGGNASIVHLNRNGTRDYGLMQINEHNLPAFGVTREQAMDPCNNIRIGGAILTANYARAVQTYGEGQRALQAALSAYNTGDESRGIANGYVARYYGHGAVPALVGSVQMAAEAAPRPPPPQHRSNPYTASTVVFVAESVNVRVE